MSTSSQLKLVHGALPIPSFWSSLRTHIALTFCILFAAIISLVELAQFLGLPFGLHEGDLQTRRSEAFHQLSLIADIEKKRLTDALAERHWDVEVQCSLPGVHQPVADLLRVSPPSPTAPPEAFRALRQEEAYEVLLEGSLVVGHAYDVPRIRIADARSGRLIFSTAPQEIGTSVADETHYQRVLTSRDTTTGNIRLDPSLEIPVLNIASPILDESKRIVAVAIYAIDTEKMLTALLRTGKGLGQSGEVVLVNDEGQVLTSLKHPLNDGAIAVPLKARIEAKPAMLAADGQEGIIEAEDYRGVPVLAAYRHIQIQHEFGWGMVVKRDRNVIMKPVARELAVTLFFVLAALLISAVGILITAGRMTRPLRSLTMAAGTLAQGDVATRCYIDRSDEIGMLANAFNQMADDVETAMSGLETAVRLRTADLAVKNQDLEEMIYVASHDLRAPLVNIEGYTAELKRDFADLYKAIAHDPELSERFRDSVQILDGSIPDALRRVETNAQRMDRLVTGVLRLSRTGRHELDMRVIEMNEAIGRLLESLEFEINREEAAVNMGHLPRCMGDEDQISQIFSNLVSNALKYRSENRKCMITISGQREGDEVVYCVEDNGIGIPPNRLDHIFRIFFRVDPGKGNGHGLGLTIVARILQRMGGCIRVESELGRGSRFFVSMPAPDEQYDQEAAYEARKGSIRWNNSLS